MQLRHLNSDLAEPLCPGNCSLPSSVAPRALPWHRHDVASAHHERQTAGKGSHGALRLRTSNSGLTGSLAASHAPETNGWPS